MITEDTESLECHCMHVSLWLSHSPPGQPATHIFFLVYKSDVGALIRLVERVNCHINCSQSIEQRRCWASRRVENWVFCENKLIWQTNEFIFNGRYLHDLTSVFENVWCFDIFRSRKLIRSVIDLICSSSCSWFVWFLLAFWCFVYRVLYSYFVIAFFV